MGVASKLAMVVFGLTLACSTARASVDIQVDLSSQTMTVTSDSGGSYVWPVSTARKGFVTPRGTYAVQSLETMHYSHKYNNAPMPHSIFFRGGYAIHGTYETGDLGHAASHGCIRLSPHHAAMLYGMVQQEGGRITVTGEAPNEIRTADIDAPDEPEPRRPRAAPRASRHPTRNPLVYVPIGPAFDSWADMPGY